MTDAMQDDYLAPPPAARRSRNGRLVLAVALLAFVAGAAGTGWLAWQGGYERLLPAALQKDTAPVKVAQAPQPAPAAAPSATLSELGTAEARLALLEERLSRLNAQAEAASGNAARAEGLLIAFAARRAIDRGAPLGPLEDQLRLRFGDAQPNAVQTVIEAAKQPVTLDELSADLEQASTTLVDAPADEDAWNRVKRELSSLFTVRTDRGGGADPRERIHRARILLTAGKVDQAIAEVERLPGAKSATAWIAAARRHAAAQRALDLIETTAMLEPRSLRDAEGQKVEQPSPLAPAIKEQAIKPQAETAPAASTT